MGTTALAPRTRRNVWLAVGLASLGWGTGGVATRAAMELGAGPYTITAVRMLLAGSLLIGWLLLTGRGLPRGRRLWWDATVIGITNAALVNLFFTFGLQYVSAGFSALLAALIPLATAVLAHLMLDERIDRRGLVGMLVALTGVGLLVSSGESGLAPGEGDPIRGALLTLVAVASAAYGGVYSRRHGPKHPVLHLVGPQLLIAGIAIAFVGAVAGDLTIAGLPRGAYALFVYLALVSTALPFSLFLWVVQRTTAAQASLVGYLVPIVGVVAGALLLRERVTLSMIGAGILILVGVVIADRSGSERPQGPKVRSRQRSQSARPTR